MNEMANCWHRAGVTGQARAWSATSTLHSAPRPSVRGLLPQPGPPAALQPSSQHPGVLCSPPFPYPSSSSPSPPPAPSCWNLLWVAQPPTALLVGAETCPLHPWGPCSVSPCHYGVTRLGDADTHSLTHFQPSWIPLDPPSEGGRDWHVPLHHCLLAQPAQAHLPLPCPLRAPPAPRLEEPGPHHSVRWADAHLGARSKLPPSLGPGHTDPHFGALRPIWGPHSQSSRLVSFGSSASPSQELWQPSCVFGSHLGLFTSPGGRLCAADFHSFWSSLCSHCHR